MLRIMLLVNELAAPALRLLSFPWKHLHWQSHVMSQKKKPQKRKTVLQLQTKIKCLCTLLECRPTETTKKKDWRKRKTNAPSGILRLILKVEGNCGLVSGFPLQTATGWMRALLQWNVAKVISEELTWLPL
ncbi:uncharacterized protein M8220_016978 isoform 2-T2 [Acridotheres tristis]